MEMTFLRRVSELSLRDGGEEFGHLGGILGRAASPLLHDPAPDKQQMCGWRLTDHKSTL